MDILKDKITAGSFLHPLGMCSLQTCCAAVSDQREKEGKRGKKMEKRGKKREKRGKRRDLLFQFLLQLPTSKETTFLFERQKEMASDLM